MKLPILNIIINERKLINKIKEAINKEEIFLEEINFYIKSSCFEDMNISFNGYKSEFDYESNIEISLNEEDPESIYLDEEDFELEVLNIIKNKLIKIAPFEVSFKENKKQKELIKIEYSLKEDYWVSGINLLSSISLSNKEEI